MTTTEGHDMTDEPTALTNEELGAIRALWSDIRTSRTEKTPIGEMVPVDIDLFDTKLPKVFAEVDRLRAELDESEQNHEKWVKFVRHELDNLRSERDDLRSELKAAKSTRFENNDVGDVAMHIQAETINDLRLN